MTADAAIEAYARAYEQMVKARVQAIAQSGDLVPLVERMLASPGAERAAAIALYEYLNQDQQEALLPAMLGQALYSHGQTKLVWSILRLCQPRTLGERLETMEHGIIGLDYEEVGCLLGLLSHLGQYDRAKAIAERLAVSGVEDVADVANAFLENHTGSP